MARSRLGKLAYGVFIAAGLLGFVEMLAHRANGRPPESEVLARAATCELKSERGRTWMECARVHDEPLFSAATQKVRKRIAVLGGSSVRDPFKKDAFDNFPEHLQHLLADAEILNLGKAGMSMTGVAWVASQLDALDPDLVVIYEGHNDFSQTTFQSGIGGVRLWTIPIQRVLGHSWIYTWLTMDLEAAGITRRRPGGSLPDDAPAGCASPPGPGYHDIFAVDDDTAIRRREALAARYREDLRTAIRAAEVPAIVSTLIRNFDNPPMAEVAPAGSACAAALACLANTRAAPAAEMAAFSAKHCGEGAVTWWYRAHAAGSEAEAVEAFRKSLALDAAPLRAPHDVDVIVREVAAEEGAQLLDLDLALGPLQRDELFHDTLHPSSLGARRIADALATAIRTTSPSPGSSPSPSW